MTAREGGSVAAVVRGLRDVTPEVREFVIEPEHGATRYAPGSHLAVDLVIEGQTQRRHYSLVGSAEAGRWRIAVHRASPGRGGSRAMWALREGARLMVSPPSSRFELSRDAPEYLLVAGGIGVTPLLGMAQALVARGAAVRMAYAGRRRAGMAYVDALGALLGERLEVYAADEGKRLGLAEAFAALGPGAEAYVCGPLGMLEAAQRAWAEAGRPPSRLRYETFGSSGRHPAEDFVVHVPRLGKQVLVRRDTTMLDALEAAGVGVIWDCRRGECGLCVVDVLGVEGAIDHRDVFFSPRQHAGGRKVCACVSRAVGGSITIDPAYRAPV